MKKYTILMMIFLIAFSSIFAARDRGAVLFLMIGPGARATGMGEAFVSVADDPTATYWNPAGLGLYPLSSEWKSYEISTDDEIVAAAAVLPSNVKIGSKKPQIWAATKDELWRLKGNDWIDYEIYITAPEERLSDILRSYISKTLANDEEAFQALVDKVIKYNDLEIEQGAYLLPDLEIRIPFRFFFNSRITTMQGTSDELLIGTENGLYSREDDRWKKYETSNTPGDKEITCIEIDEQNNFAIGTNDGLFINKFGKWIKYNTSLGLPSNKIQSIYMDNVNRIWVGTEIGAAKLGTTKFEKTYDMELPTDSVMTWEKIAKDYFDISSEPKLDYFVSALRVSNDAISESQKPRKRITVDYDPIFESSVTAIYPDKNGIWFGTELGVKYFDGTKWKKFGWEKTVIEKEQSYLEYVNRNWPELNNDDAEDLAERIRRFNLSNSITIDADAIIEVPDNPASGRIETITMSPEGEIFVATEYGLLIYNDNKQAFSFYGQQGMENKKVSQIVNMKDKYVFNTGEEINWYARGERGITLMHVRWLPQLASDMYYEYLSGTYYIEGWGTVGGSFTFMYMGESEYRSESGELLGTFNSYEMALGLSYGTTILPNFAGGLNFKLVHSSLAQGVRVGNELKDGTATTFAVDLGLSYQTPVEGLHLGLNVQNFGPDVVYIDEAQSDPLPRNLKLGMSYNVFENEFNRVLFSADINKGIISNFLDENERDPLWMEWHEAVKNFGLEYTYADFISFRGGYILDYDYIRDTYSGGDEENELNKNDWKSINYFTIGVGVEYDTYSFDFGYIPEQKSDGESTLPLSNIMRFSLTASF
ncbi:MAG: PorV/PorQ family protein [Candidatus Zixiibacteriota bacterium]